MKRDKINLRQLLAANIKEQRQLLGFSQEKLAEMSGLSWQTINSIECLRTWVSDNTLEALARTFNIETYQLLLPPEVKTALSHDPAAKLRKLAEAKKTYDHACQEIVHGT